MLQPHFTVFRVPVHVQPFFWLLNFWFASLQYSSGSLFNGSFHIDEPASFALWFPIVFLAILLHELGHAVVGRRFGASPFIVLSGLGGYTQLQGQRFTPGRAALVSFAGPLVGLVIGGTTLLYTMFSPIPHGPIVSNALHDVIWTNLGWAIFNLIPIVGLDGGNIMAALFDKGFGQAGVRAALVISIFVAVGIVTLLWSLALAFHGQPPLWETMIFGLFAMRNYRDWQMLGRWSDKLRPQGGTARAPARAATPTLSDERIEQELERGFRALEERNAAMVRRIGEALVPHIRNEDQRFQVAHLVGWGRLLTGDVSGARRALQQLLPPGQLPDALLEGCIRLELGNAEDAVGSLAEAIVGRSDDFVASRLARAVVTSGRIEPVLALLASEKNAAAVGPRPFQIIGSELAYAGRHEAARQIGEALFERFHEGPDAFNVACALGKLERLEDALVWLEKALDAGLPDKSVLDTDADIAAVRALPGFQALREKAGLPST